MKVFTAVCVLFFSIVANASNIYGPNLVLIKGNECVPSQMIINMPGLQHYPNGFPYNEFTLLTGVRGSTETMTSIGGDLGAYTGLHVNNPNLVRGWQPNPGEPPTAVQLACTEAGFLVNSAQGSLNATSVQYKVTWAIPSSVHLDESFSSQIPGSAPDRVKAGAPQIRPWAQGGEPDLILQANVRIPTATITPPTNPNDVVNVQYNFLFYVLDTVSGRVFSYIINLYDNRVFNNGMGASHDTYFPFISIMLPPDGSHTWYSQYYNLSPYSAGSSITPFAEWRFFRVHVGRPHLINAIQALNAAHHINMSLDPSDYLLIDAGIIQEHQSPPGSTIKFGSSLQGFGVYTANNPAIPGQVTALDGGGQAAMLGETFQYPIRVRVTDGAGNPVPNVTVTFTGPASGASTNPVSYTATTTYLGEAMTTPTANGIAGTYTVTASVSVAGASSATFTLTNNAPPTISLGTNGTTFTPSTPVILTANGGDSDGSITQIGLYANGQPIAYGYAAPYTASWTAQPGSYTLFAIAWDNKGGYAYSNSVNIVVNPDPSCTTGPVTLDYSGSLFQPNTGTGDIPAYQGWTMTWAFTAGAGAQSSFREFYNAYYWPQPDNMTWSVSKCKGDFVGTGLCYPGYMYMNGGMNVLAYADDWACRIEPNTVYYLNLRVNSCNGTCGFRLQRIN